MKRPVKDWKNLPDLLDTQTVALILEVCEASVRRMCRNGELPARKLGPRLWRISKAELMEHMGVRV